MWVMQLPPPWEGRIFNGMSALIERRESGMQLLKFELICSKLLYRLKHTNLGIPAAKPAKLQGSQCIPYHPIFSIILGCVCTEEVEFGPEACTVWKNVR